ncbi:MAG: DUF1801 domain-containing protein [Chloroflexota bacterium]
MNRNPDVETFMTDLEHPLKAELLRVREIILQSDDKIQEAIKWKAPTFFYKKNLLTLTVRTKKHVHLFFQQGALLGERFGILEGDAEQVRVARFHTMAEVEANKGAIEAVVRAWVALQGG